MNKLAFIIEDCAKETKHYYLKSVAGGYAIPNYTKTMFVEAARDLVCERAASGVRFQGKEKIAALITEYMTTKQAAFFNTLND